MINRELNFYDGILAPWEHLTAIRSEIYTRLAQPYGEATAQRAVTYIYDNSDLNRLCEDQYIKLFDESGFSLVIVVRKRAGVATKVPGASTTRELLMVLKKGHATLWERVYCFSRFAVAFGSQQIRARLAG